MKKIASLLLCLSFFSCGDESDYGRLDPIVGRSMCHELNLVTRQTLELHYSKTSEDISALYRQSLLDLVQNTEHLWNGLDHRESGSHEGGLFRNSLEGERERIKSLSAAELPKRMEACEDLERINKLRSSLRQDEFKSFYEFEIKQDLYWEFLEVFAQNLDAYSRFQRVAGYGAQHQPYGIQVEQAPLAYMSPQESLRIIASDPKLDLPSESRIKEFKLYGSNRSPQFSRLVERRIRVSELHHPVELQLLKYVFQFQAFHRIDIWIESPELDTLKRYRLGEDAEVQNPKLLAQRNQNTLYLKLFQFTQGAAIEVLDSVHRHQNAWEEERDEEDNRRFSIVLDLRFNPGGSQQEMEWIAGAFLPSGPVGTTQQRSGTSYETKSFYLHSLDDSIDQPLIVLTNNQSGSASEILAHILQEQKRAIVLGTSTFGKGIGQVSLPILLGSFLPGVMTFTHTMFFGKDGSSIHAKGVDPDIEVEHPRHQKMKQNCQKNFASACPLQHMSEQPKAVTIKNQSISRQHRFILATQNRIDFTSSIKKKLNTWIETELDTSANPDPQRSAASQLVHIINTENKDNKDENST